LGEFSTCGIFETSGIMLSTSETFSHESSLIKIEEKWVGLYFGRFEENIGRHLAALAVTICLLRPVSAKTATLSLLTQLFLKRWHLFV
jgi:hypothetical protein